MALDQITKALVADFLDNSGMASQGESVDFEKFCAHTLIAPQIDTAIPFEHVVAGAGNDTGIDAIGIIINGEIVTDIDEIDALANAGTTLDVHYVFIQTETTNSFSTSKIGQIVYGVKDFFSEEPSLVRNTHLKSQAELSERIMDNARLFKNRNPVCSVYYITAGRLQEDSDLDARRASARSDVDDLNYFSEVSFTLIDAREIQRRYQSLQRGVEKSFTFQNRVALPEMHDVAEAHLGFISSQDLLEVLQDEEGHLLQSIFYENVRDFQGGKNPVNQEIAETLEGASKSRFVLMNNGVTMIAKGVQQTGTKFFVRDFQVVNGCQTCNVLWAHRTSLDETVMVPLRLISTTHEDVIIDIIRATNRQTEVKTEQFYATSDYLKQLEMFFESAPQGERLFLERRLKQHVNSPGVERTRVVPFNSLVRSFASIVLAEPHRATRNYKQVLERIPSDILNPAHRPVIYYATASALYRLEYMFRSGAIDRRFSPARYHLLLAAQLLSDKPLPKFLNSKEAERWGRETASIFWDPTRSDALYTEAANLIERLSEGDLTRDKIRTLPFTDKVLGEFK